MFPAFRRHQSAPSGRRSRAGSHRLVRVLRFLEQRLDVAAVGGLGGRAINETPQHILVDLAVRARHLLDLPEQTLKHAAGTVGGSGRNLFGSARSVFLSLKYSIEERAPPSLFVGLWLGAGFSAFAPSFFAPLLSGSSLETLFASESLKIDTWLSVERAPYYFG